ncbi:hypothetical protein ACIS_00213 [Anaplasma centrale str. Israel]|uniref:Uncharacterized protein n=1 Tax=Anaplasma centrale (strain Israel) TaxID=574556 RepID=D1ATL1_ANACI|nr:hypothetical protein [Anaplasma centrale]ACZ48889.1 hypothetical protein ACIS_00213 [Anaplasma centrale str. Israel]
MKAENCGWIGVFCVLSLCMGGITYFVLECREILLNVSANVERLADERTRVSPILSDVLSEVQQLKNAIPRKRTIVVNKEGCARAECLARVLLMVADLRKAFALGAMSHDAVYAVKPMLVELHDQQIDDSFRAVEVFNSRKGYRDLIEDLSNLRKGLRTTMAGPIGKRLSKWISIENHNETMWQEFERLERLARQGAWEDCLEVANDASLSSVPGIKSWAKDLESVLEVDRSLSTIYDRLIERVNSNPEGI